MVPIVGDCCKPHPIDGGQAFTVCASPVSTELETNGWILEGKLLRWTVTTCQASATVSDMDENEMNFQISRDLLARRGEVERALSDTRPGLGVAEIERRAGVIFDDVILLARCARSQCLITYANAIGLRRHGNPQNGQWLDDVFA